MRPYDAAGWTLPLQMGVRIGTATAPLEPDVLKNMKFLGTLPGPKAKPVPYNSGAAQDPAPFDSVPGIGFDTNPAAAAILPPPGKIAGTGPALAVDPAQNNAFRAVNLAWKQGASVQIASVAAGSAARYLISGLAETKQIEIINTLALSAERTAAGGTPIQRARIGVFEPWTASMDAGWTRWVLEQYGFESVVLRPEDFKGPLRDKVDVIFLADDVRIPGAPDSGGRGRGAGPGGMPPGAATGAARGPVRATRPEYAYSLTEEDLRAFESFIRDGGTLVCFNDSYRFAVQQFKLPVRNTVDGLQPEEFFLRGSIVEVETDPTHPIMAGMPETAAVFADGSPVFETLDGFQGKVMAKYRESGSPLLSGYLIGEKFLQGRAAALDVEFGKGHIVLLGFRPQWRGQPFGTFRIIFNAAMNAF
jgi:ribosomal protein S18 acetylase RimI-like enzyme